MTDYKIKAVPGKRTTKLRQVLVTVDFPGSPVPDAIPLH